MPSTGLKFVIGLAVAAVCAGIVVGVLFAVGVLGRCKSDDSCGAINPGCDTGDGKCKICTDYTLTISKTDNVVTFSPIALNLTHLVVHYLDADFKATHQETASPSTSTKFVLPPDNKGHVFAVARSIKCEIKSNILDPRNTCERSSGCTAGACVNGVCVECNASLLPAPTLSADKKMLSWSPVKFEGSEYFVHFLDWKGHEQIRSTRDTALAVPADSQGNYYVTYKAGTCSGSSSRLQEFASCATEPCVGQNEICSMDKLCFSRDNLLVQVALSATAKGLVSWTLPPVELTSLELAFTDTEGVNHKIALPVESESFQLPALAGNIQLFINPKNGTPLVTPVREPLKTCDKDTPCGDGLTCSKFDHCWRCDAFVLSLTATESGLVSWKLPPFAFTSLDMGFVDMDGVPQVVSLPLTSSSYQLPSNTQGNVKLTATGPCTYQSATLEPIAACSVTAACLSADSVCSIHNLCTKCADYSVTLTKDASFAANSTVRWNSLPFEISRGVVVYIADNKVQSDVLSDPKIQHFIVPPTARDIRVYLTLPRCGSTLMSTALEPLPALESGTYWVNASAPQATCGVQDDNIVKCLTVWGTPTKFKLTRLEGKQYMYRMETAEDVPRNCYVDDGKILTCGTQPATNPTAFFIHPGPAGLFTVANAQDNKFCNVDMTVSCTTDLPSAASLYSFSKFVPDQPCDAYTAEAWIEPTIGDRVFFKVTPIANVTFVQQNSMAGGNQEGIQGVAPVYTSWINVAGNNAIYFDITLASGCKLKTNVLRPLPQLADGDYKIEYNDERWEPYQYPKWVQCGQPLDYPVPLITSNLEDPSQYTLTPQGSNQYTIKYNIADRYCRLIRGRNLICDRVTGPGELITIDPLNYIVCGRAVKDTYKFTRTQDDMYTMYSNINKKYCGILDTNIVCNLDSPQPINIVPFGESTFTIPATAKANWFKFSK